MSYRSVKINKGISGWGKFIIVAPKEGKDKVISVTGGGIHPLAKITSGTNKGAYGPYDPKATDGRQTAIAGLLESAVAVNVTYSGWQVDDTYVGLRYRGDIIKSKLPVVPADEAKWGGCFYDVEDDAVTALSGSAGAAGSAGVGVKSITLTKNTSGAITGGTWVGTDDKSHAFTVA